MSSDNGKNNPKNKTDKNFYPTHAGVGHPHHYRFKGKIKTSEQENNSKRTAAKGKSFGQKWSEDTSVNKILAIANVILAGFTIVLAIKTIDLVEISQHQISISDSTLQETRQMNDSILARTDSTLKLTKDIAHQSDSTTRAVLDSTLERTDSSLALTNRSLEMAKKHFEIQNRAYITVETAFFSYKINEPYEILTIFKNEGNTPAFNCKFNSYTGVDTIKSFYAKMDSIMKLDFLNAVNRSGGSVLNLKEQRQNTHISPGIIDAIIDIQIRGNDFGLFQWGYVVYDDAFGNPRYKIFCRKYDFRKASFIIISQYEKSN